MITGDFASRYLLDRFEGGFAILMNEEEQPREVPTALLPEEAQEGDLLVLEYGMWTVDKEETATRRARIETKLDALWED